MLIKALFEKCLEIGKAAQCFPHPPSEGIKNINIKPDFSGYTTENAQSTRFLEIFRDFDTGLTRSSALVVHELLKSHDSGSEHES